MTLHSLPLRVYYEDTDFSGLVYHASYLRFLERGRTEMLRAAGVDQHRLFTGSGDAAPFAFVVRRMAIDWLKPALMDDVVTVETRVTELRGASLSMAQRIVRAEEILLTAEVVVAGVSGGRAARLPATVRALLGAALAG